MQPEKFPCHRDKKQLAEIVIGGYVGLFVCKARHTHFKETVFLDFFRKCRLIRVKRWVDKNKIEAIDSKEMIRIENLGTRLPHGFIYTVYLLKTFSFDQMHSKCICYKVEEILKKICFLKSNKSFPCNISILFFHIKESG